MERRPRRLIHSPESNITAADTYVAGPLTADSAGNIYYNAIELPIRPGATPGRMT